MIRAVRADVTPLMRWAPAGWTLDASNCGIGRHHSDRFQDPTLVKPEMSEKITESETEVSGMFLSFVNCLEIS